MPPYMVSSRSPLGEALLGEDFLQPVLRGPVLGEDDDPLVAPLLAGPDVRRSASRSGTSTFESSWPDACSAHVPHLLEQGQFLVGRLAEQQRGGVHGVGRRLVVLVVVGVVLVDPVEFLLQDADRTACGRPCPAWPAGATSRAAPAW